MLCSTRKPSSKSWTVSKMIADLRPLCLISASRHFALATVSGSLEDQRYVRNNSVDRNTSSAAASNSGPSLLAAAEAATFALADAAAAASAAEIFMCRREGDRGPAAACFFAASLFFVATALVSCTADMATDMTGTGERGHNEIERARGHTIRQT